ncbi:hypothetical protein ACFLTD_05210, partial [Elusimicrobiota bacterium]
MKNKVIIVFILYMSICCDLRGTGVGTTRLNFLKIYPGSRPAAMGGAFGAVTGSIYAINWNPAGLVMLGQKEASFTHLKWIEEINYSWAGYAVPFERDNGIGGDSDIGTVMIDDFNDSADPSLIGGDILVWNDSATGGRSAIFAGYSRMPHEGKRSYVYEVSYAVRPRPDGQAGYGGIRMSLEKINVERNRFVSVLINVEKGEGLLKLGLRDSKGREKTVRIQEYFEGKGGWEEVLVPLDCYSGVDLSELDKLIISFSGSGKIYLDDIKFSGHDTPGEAFAVSVGYFN